MVAVNRVIEDLDRNGEAVFRASYRQAESVRTVALQNGYRTDPPVPVDRLGKVWKISVVDYGTAA